MNQSAVDFIPIEKVAPSPDNPRKDVGDVKELAESVRAQGVINPVIVVPVNGGYQLVAGERRWAAAKVAGLMLIPAIVRSDLDEKARAEIALIENLQREDLAPTEEAEAYQRLLALDYSQRDLAARIGRNQSHISKRLSLLALPPKTKKAVDAGSIALGDAVELAKIADTPDLIDAVLAARKEAEDTGELEYFSVAYEVRDVKEAKERQTKYEELAVDAKAKAETDGVKFVEGKKTRYGEWQLPKGTEYLNRGTYGSVEMKLKDHAKQPCHGITVIPGRFSHQEPEIAYVCTKPKSHPSPKSRAQTRRDTESKKDKEQRQALEAATAARRTFIKEKLLTKRLNKGDVLKALVLAVANDDFAEVDFASELLDLEDGERLADFAAKNERQLLQAGMAMAIAPFEDHLDQRWAWRRGGAVKAYFALLTRHGYRRSEAERKALAEQ